MSSTPPAGPREWREYRVRIEYREPTFHPDGGPRDTPYTWTFRVRASSEEAALALARDEFRDVERQSGVGWVRVIVSTTVEEVTG